jgi:hypothetical protein
VRGKVAAGALEIYAHDIEAKNRPEQLAPAFVLLQKRCALSVDTGQFRRRGKFFFDLRETVFEDIESDGGFVFGNDEGRAEANGGFSAAEDHEAFFEAEGLDAVAQLRGGFAAVFILHQFDTDHEAAAADIANERMSCFPCLQTVEHFAADFCCVANPFALEDIDGG